MMTKKTKTIDLIMCTAFAALIAVGAYIRFYVGVVPFTMQVFFVILAGMLLGPTPPHQEAVKHVCC